MLHLSDEERGCATLKPIVCQFVVSKGIKQTVRIIDIFRLFGEVIAVIRKTNEVPPTLYNDAQNLRELCEMQSQTVAAFSSFNFSMKYHIRRRFYIIVQNIMRRFSPQFKAKLKKYLFHKQ